MKILSVNISKEKGTPKYPVSSITLDTKGIIHDAHRGQDHKHISLLNIEFYPPFTSEKQFAILDCKDSEKSVKINKLIYSENGKPNYGIYAENLTVKSSPSDNFRYLKQCNIGDRFVCGELVMEVSQIGKHCEMEKCQLYKVVGTCEMPKEGIFTRVLHGGTLKAGDELKYIPKVWKTAVITLSTRAYNGIYEDLSGPLLSDRIKNFCQKNHWPTKPYYKILSDDSKSLKAEVKKLIDENYDFIFTTGGTGIGPSDITVDTLRPLLDKEIPSIMDFIKMKYGAKNPNALISTSIAGIASNSIIFCVPGSVKAVKEYIDEIEKVIGHMYKMHIGLSH
ncbi:MAG: molybdenum cofactor synthesis domain-containing protein [Bacteroidales bacterium]